MKSFLLPRETQSKLSVVRRVLSDIHCDMEALIASGGVMGLRLFWNSAVNKCVLVSNSGGLVHAEQILFNVTVSLRPSSTQIFTTKLCAHLPQKILLTPSTQTFSHTSHKKKVVWIRKHFVQSNIDRRAFAIFSLYSLLYGEGYSHRKTLTSKDKYRGFYYIKNLTPIRLSTFQWSTFRCFLQFLIRNTDWMSEYLYNLPSFGVIKCSLADGLSQSSGFPANLIVISGFQQTHTVTSAGDKGPVRSLKALNTMWGSTIKPLSNERTSLAFLMAVYNHDVSE